MMTLSRGLLAATLLALYSPVAMTAPGVEEAAAADAAMVAPAEQAPALRPQRGVIELPGGMTRLDVPDSFFYLSPEDTEKVLVSWGNPPGNRTLGMLVPSDVGADSEDSWAVVITYDNSGHVADDDAAEIDYDELLADMKTDNESVNQARREAGYGAVDLVGWAEAPRYDAGTHKFYWAKQLRFDGAPADTLNYSVRVLGREGVLELNAVASMDQIDRVRAGMPAIIDMASFSDGQRYADFNEATDHMAAYGLAALVAGGAAAKVGLWAKLLALVIAFKKFILFGVIALGAWGAQVFSRRKGKQADKVDA